MFDGIKTLCSGEKCLRLVTQSAPGYSRSSGSGSWCGHTSCWGLSYGAKDETGIEREGVFYGTHHTPENVLYCVLCVYLLSDAVCGGEDPLRADEGAATQVLVQGVDQGNLQKRVSYSWHMSLVL